MSKKSSSADEFLKQAYSLADDRSKLEFYKQWADEYDLQMQDNLGYRSPAIITQALASYVLDKQTPVLDVGCGTGLAAQAMSDLGYTTIDGLDYSAEMIKIAAQKNIYRELFEADLNLPLEMDDSRYGAILCTGTFTHGHVGPEPIDELLRVLTSGGYLACTVHCDLWQKSGFEKKFNALRSDRRIRTLYRENKAYFEGGERDGWFCVFQKL